MASRRHQLDVALVSAASSSERNLRPFALRAASSMSSLVASPLRTAADITLLTNLLRFAVSLSMLRRKCGPTLVYSISASRSALVISVSYSASMSVTAGLISPSTLSSSSGPHHSLNLRWHSSPAPVPAGGGAAGISTNGATCGYSGNGGGLHAPPHSRPLKNPSPPSPPTTSMRSSSRFALSQLVSGSRAHP